MAPPRLLVHMRCSRTIEGRISARREGPLQPWPDQAITPWNARLLHHPRSPPGKRPRASAIAILSCLKDHYGRTFDSLKWSCESGFIIIAIVVLIVFVRIDGHSFDVVTAGIPSVRPDVGSSGKPPSPGLPSIDGKGRCERHHARACCTISVRLHNAVSAVDKLSLTCRFGKPPHRLGPWWPAHP